MSMSMLVPSSFALSCRRRSHSASSPSPSPVPASAWRPAHKRAHSSHRDAPALPDSQRCHLDIWRTGKRPRRDTPPAHSTRSSTPASADSTTSSSSSPPHTPLFPVSSADFLLFPSHPLNLTTPNPRSPSFAIPFLHDDTYESELVRLRSEAFLELRRSVQESGEGFVQRMREFEDSRSKSVQHPRPRGVEKRRKKRYSPSVSTTRPCGKVTISDDDGDDDILINSNAHGSESFHPRQRRSSSLGAMDNSDFQLHSATDPSGRLSPISGIFHPFPPRHCTSPIHSSATSKPTELSTSFTTTFDFTTNLHHTSACNSVPTHPSSDSITSADVFLSSPHTENASSPSSSFMASPPYPPSHLSAGTISASACSTEKVIATLTLAMANGAGSLGDYEAVRALNVSSADESQAGELWH